MSTSGSPVTTTGPPAPSADAHPASEVDLLVEGMTCASCVNRVEKKLNKIDGAKATVNLATDSAHVALSTPVDDDTLLAALRAAGYDGRVTRRSEAAVGAGAGTGAGTELAAATDPAAGSAEPPEFSHLGDDGNALDTSTPTERRAADLRRRLVVCAVLALPVVVLSMIPAWQFPGWQWVVCALALPIATWGAWPFHRAALRAARHGSSTMDTLVSLGVVASTGWSLWAITLGGSGEIGMRMDMSLWPGGGHADAHPHLYFETAALIVVFLLAGRYAEARSRHRAGDALRSLLELGAKDAALVEVDAAGRRTATRVPVGRLAVGDLFMVRPGEKVATDGVVVEGASALDTSLLTGESVPVEVAAGDQVTGATISTSGALLVRAERVGEATTLAQIGRLVTRAQSGKAPVQRLADRISAVFVPVVVIIALLTLAGWLIAGAGAEAAFTAAVAVLVVACPCALGLATPTALLVGTGRAAQLGVLIKGPEILESTRQVDTVVLDKTGTVTAGSMTLTSVVTDGEVDEERALALAAAAESGSEHPVARAIADAAGRSDLPRVIDFANHAGTGVEATLDAGGTVLRVLVGRPGWLAGRGVDTSPTAHAHARAEDDVATAVVLAWEGRSRAVLAVRDEVRASSPGAIAELRELGLTPHLLTGDNAGVARRVAADVGIDPAQVTAGVLPADKVDAVRDLQERGHVVAMVGDGVNDAAALAQADLGMAMGTGTDVAIQAADITLVRADLAAVPVAIRISRRTLAIIRQNLFWAFAYNVAAIPIAAAGLLNPAIAALAMSLSSVIVVLNSLRLRRAG